MISNIHYTGKVTVKVKGKPAVKTKNAGTVAFFNLLSKILSQMLIPTSQGADAFSRHLPSYIVVMKSTSNTLTPENYTYQLNSEDKLVFNEIPITNYKFDTDKVFFQGVLNNSNIKTDIDTQGQCHVLLLDGNRENILAYTAVDLQYFREVKDNQFSQATITWEMTFSNSEEEL